jgi:inner membrane protein
LPDFDHDFKRENVLILIIVGLSLAFLLYVLHLPYYIGLILVLLGFIFLLSSHRGFTHSILGIIILSLLVSFIIISGVNFIIYFSVFSSLINFKVALFLVITIFSLFVLNKRIIPIFLVLFILSLFFIPAGFINYLTIFASVFLGFLSHIVLDSFSSSGIKLFTPFSDRKVYKKFGIILTFLLIIFSIPHLMNLIKLLFNIV